MQNDRVELVLTKMDLNKQSDQSSQLNEIATLTSVPTHDSSPNIIWNENEETFLQNLLANTLLSDDLVEKTDLDLGLGFDNLQLNYDSSSTEPLPSQLTIVSLDDQVQTDILATQNLLLSDPDDTLFKKPSNDFLTMNGPKIKKKSTLTSTSAQNSETSKTKRSVKRSKISNRPNQEVILSKSVPVGKNFKHRNNNPSNCNGQNFLKFSQPKKLQHKKSHKISSSISSSDSVIQKPDKEIFELNEPRLFKRDEFDLQIKELSLLDLHSSEDDTSHQDPNNQKIPVRKTNSKTDLSKEDHGNLSQIIAKRIKYSQNTQEQSDESGNGCKQKLDKFIKYFKSLDSVEKESSAKKSLDSLLSPPSPSNPKIQNKRKKKEVAESPSSPLVFISLEQASIPNSTFSLNLENDTLLHMKNLDINTEQTDNTVNLDIRNKNSRSYLWNMLKENSSQEELTEYLGSTLHDKISFWDLVQLKLKYSKSNHLKTIYEIIDDYTKLYSNMSTLLERFVNEQSNINSLISKSENSSRSRSSSRNIRKPSSNSLNK